MNVRKNAFHASLAVISIVGLGLCSGCGTQIGIAASPSELFVEVDSATTVNVIALMDAGAPTTVTDGLTITSDDPAVAEVSGQVVTGISEGSAILTITDGVFTTTANVTVVGAGSIPAGLVVTPATITCTPASAPTQLEVFAVLPSGASEDITELASFRSNNSSVAVVTTDGSVVCVSVGNTLARAEYLGKFSTSAVTVIATPPVSVNFIPSTITCAVGDTLAVLVRTVAADGTSTDASQTAIYTSNNNQVAFAIEGLVTCRAVGTTTITANVSGVLGDLEVDVRTVVGGPDELVGLSFLPTSLSCFVTGSPAFVLIAEFGDGDNEDVTNSLGTFYQSLNPSVVKILSNQPVCVQRGETIIRAEFAGFQASASITVQ